MPSNSFALGVFAANADGGLSLTTAPERWPARWQDIVRVARIADAAGFEFFLPIARWKGFGGVTDSRGHSFETLTFAAALAAHTRRIRLFATVHAPMVHPVFAAKALATIDHASDGRAGLNLVCGWNPDEFAAFGLAPVADRYAQGAEWHEIVRRIHAGESFDFDGAHYRLRGVCGRPAPRAPVPLVNAAFSPDGRAFAAAHADQLLTTFTTLAQGAATVADIAARAAAHGRTVDVLATAHVVCRATDAEAEAAYHRYAVALADAAAVDRHMAGKQAHSGSHDAEAYRLHRARFAGGAGTYPLVGSPARIAAECRAMQDAGFCGVALAFLDYFELAAFVADVLPLLRGTGG